MIRHGRGSTGAARPAALPAGTYDPPELLRHEQDGLVLDFHGEDERSMALRFEVVPLVGWRQLLAVALAQRIGPAGRLRTQASVRGQWDVMLRFVRFLHGLSDAPAIPSRLRRGHLEAFHAYRRSRIGDRYARTDIVGIRALLFQQPLRDELASCVLDYFATRVQKVVAPPKPGYSDGEFRRLVGAARSDVAAIRARLAASETLLARFADGLDGLARGRRQDAEDLNRMAESGAVPTCLEDGLVAWTRRRREVAERLFVTNRDLTPLMVLLAVVTGRNGETIKELPAEHTVLEGRAVQLRVIKRRRGQQRWFETVTWEIGPAHRELHTPGGLYLLLHRLMRRSREFTGGSSLWAIWRHCHDAGRRGRLEHGDPFAKSVATNFYLNAWAARHGLACDGPGQLAEDTDATPAPPLDVDFNRIKTSVEVRRTKQMGGHLPSAARTNTVPVLFRDYLRADPTVIDWAQEVMDEALADVEQSAMAAHQRALDAAGGALRVVAGPVTTVRLEEAGLDSAQARRAAAGELDTAWSVCVNHDEHPRTGKPCEASFLACFHCGNCLITRTELPRLLGLLDALDARRQQMSQDDWWGRYGTTWAAIRLDVLARFTPAEIEQAAVMKPVDALLDLVENPWNQP